MSAWTYKTDNRNLERLFTLARDKSAGGRQELAQVMSDMFSATSDQLSDRERALMGAALPGRASVEAQGGAERPGRHPGQ